MNNTMAKILKNKMLLIIVVLCQFGCVTRTLVYQQKDFKPHNLNSIAVLPVIDDRIEVLEKINFEEETEKIQPLIVKKLKKKGYVSEMVDDTNAIGNIQPAQIPFLDARRIRKIGPSDANWVLLPVVYAANGYAIGVICYLYEKQIGKLIWEGSAYHSKPKKVIKLLMKKFPSKK